MKTVHEVSKLSGISVRALHHYDAIGLLKPTAVTPAGYRLYDDAALVRLQSILFFRKLEFSLKDIRTILDSPNFDPQTALQQQIELLEMRSRHLQNVLALARKIAKTGVMTMDFTVFDESEFQKFAAEAKAKWGDTDAYAEYARRDKPTAGASEMMRQFAELGKLKQLPPDAPEVQSAIDALRQFISDHFYTCTPQILAGLGQMYTADERFRRNIDAHGGDGTAEFVGKAIQIYCQA